MRRYFRILNITPLISLGITCYIFYFVHNNISQFNRENEEILKVKNYNCNYSICPALNSDLFNIHIIPYSHMDTSWLKTFDEYYNGSEAQIDKANVKEILNSVLKALKANLSRTFVISEIAFFQRWWNDIDEDKKTDIRILIKRGQLQFVSGGFVINDEALTFYSSIIDQMSLGLNFIKNTFGLCSRPKVGWQMDNFGHSKEMAYMLQKMGFQAIFLSRVSENIIQKMSVDGFQFLWKTTSKSNWKSNFNNSILTIILPDGYCTPEEFCVDSRCNQYNKDIKTIAKHFVSYVRHNMLYYKSRHILIPFGCDFHFQDATRTFNIFDRILKIVNDNQKDFKVFYSTPNCYLKSVLKSVNTLKIFDSDLLPLHNTQTGYWIGFYSTRPVFKRHIRITNNIVRTCKKITSLSEWTFNQKWLNLKDSLYQLSKAIAMMQHHDTITGTSRAVVMKSNLIDTLKCQKEGNEIFVSSLDIIMKHKLKSYRTILLSDCPLLNISFCNATDNIPLNVNVDLLLYNPLPYPHKAWISLPVSLFHRESYEVSDIWNMLIKADLLPIDRWLLKNKERPNISKAKFNLVFKVQLPELGFITYSIKRKLREFWDLTEKVSIKTVDTQKNLIISNKFLHLNLDLNTDIITLNKSGKIFNFSLDIQCYCSNTEQTNLMSGLYISAFRESPKKLRFQPFTYFLNGSVVKEVRRKYKKRITVTIRLFEDEDSLEIEWSIGGLNKNKNFNEEYIVVYKSVLMNEGVFYTDSNGRQLMKRIFDPQSPKESSYYPITSHVLIGKDNELGMLIHTDRSHGVGGRKDASIEIMVNRILVTSDGAGFTENLQDMGPGQKYIAVMGKNWLEFDEMKKLKINHRIKSNEISNSPFLFIKTYGIAEIYLKIHSGIRKQRKNLHILTLEPLMDSMSVIDRHLLRMENLLDFSGNETLDIENRLQVNIRDLFEGYEIIEVVEMNLSADREVFSEETKFHNMVVVLDPMEILTLIIKMVPS